MSVGDATVMGRIDRMDRMGDGRIVVTDYKTGKPKSKRTPTRACSFLSMPWLPAQSGDTTWMRWSSITWRRTLP